MGCNFQRTSVPVFACSSQDKKQICLLGFMLYEKKSITIRALVSRSLCFVNAKRQGCSEKSHNGTNFSWKRYFAFFIFKFNLHFMYHLLESSHLFIFNRNSLHKTTFHLSLYVVLNFGIHRLILKLSLFFYQQTIHTFLCLFRNCILFSCKNAYHYTADKIYIYQCALWEKSLWLQSSHFTCTKYLFVSHWHFYCF